MNHDRKLSALKLAVLLGTLSTLLTGCFVWRDHDHDRGESRHEEHEHHDEDHH